jgi:hypothetical protein
MAHSYFDRSAPDMKRLAHAHHQTSKHAPSRSREERAFLAGALSRGGVCPGAVLPPEASTGRRLSDGRPEPMASADNGSEEEP